MNRFYRNARMRIMTRAMRGAGSRRGDTLSVTLLCLLIGMIAGIPAWGRPVQNPAYVLALLSRMEARAAQLRDYTVVGMDDRQGKQSRWKLYFKRPDLVRIDTHGGQVTVQPDGEIRGRLGHGLFGRISQRLDRNDRRLRDASGDPFWESDYAGAIRHIRSRIIAGAGATLTVTPDAYDLQIRAGPALWRCVIDPDTLFFRETSCSENGQLVCVTHYGDFRPNTGLDNKVFEF